MVLAMKPTLIHKQILAYARQTAGTADDPDEGLEAAGIEHLLSEEKARKESKRK